MHPSMTTKAAEKPQIMPKADNAEDILLSYVVA
jgi:hypothetical protein